jgi:putative transposase
MAENFGVKFSRERLALRCGGVFDFDAVGEDRSIVATISTSGAKTASGKLARSKMLKLHSDMLFLTMVEANFVQVLRQLRQETGFLLIGWVLMPEHLHFLIKPEPAEATSRFMPELQKRTAQRMIATLAGSPHQRWCRAMLARLRLPPSVHCDSRYRVWQRRFVPFNVYTEKKRTEKLNYMPNNPVKRRLVSSPDQWPWSSFRFYYLNDSSVLTIDRLG